MIKTNPVYKVTVELIIDVNNKSFVDSGIDSIIEQYLANKFTEDLGSEIEFDCYFDSYEVQSILPISED